MSANTYSLPRATYRTRRCERDVDASGKPIAGNEIEIFYRDKWRTIREWAKHYKMVPNTIAYRYRNHIALDADVKGSVEYIMRKHKAKPSLGTRVAMMPAPAVDRNLHRRFPIEQRPFNWVPGDAVEDGDGFKQRWAKLDPYGNELDYEYRPL